METRIGFVLGPEFVAFAYLALKKRRCRKGAMVDLANLETSELRQQIHALSERVGKQDAMLRSSSGMRSLSNC